jgi:DUF1009 family protein
MDADSPIGVIVGGGELPKQLIQAWQSMQRAFVVVALEGHVQKDWVNALGVPVCWARLGIVMPVLDFLRAHQIRDLVAVGHVKRPNISSLRCDRTGLSWVRKLGRRFFQGDDHLLTGIKLLLQSEGFQLHKPADWIPCLLTHSVGATWASSQDREDWIRGQQILDALSPCDVGQSVVVQHGCVLGIECAEGTQALIQRCIPFKLAPVGGVLIKQCKRGQSLVLDVPTIGVQTLEMLHLGKFSGVVIDSATQVIYQEICIEYAHQHHIFLIQRPTTDILFCEEAQADEKSYKLQEIDACAPYQAASSETRE